MDTDTRKNGTIPTIKDVALHAGVSIATASRALAGNPHVNPSTRERVLQAVAALGYRPDQVARSLRLRRTSLIGLLVSTIENVFFTEVARAAEQAAHLRGYNLIVCNTEENPQREETYLTILDQQMVAGLILAPAPGDAKHLQRFVKAGLPIVVVNRRIDHLPLSSVVCNDRQAAYACTRLLISEGRRRIAAITGLSGISTTRERLAGYRDALQAADLPMNPELEISGQANLQGGYQAADQLMHSESPPDAIFAFNNLMTQGAVMVLQDLQLRWPDQIDVAGFGAFSAARFYRPPLHLIAQPTHEMGRRAVDLLIDQVEGRASQGPQAIVLSNQLVSRSAWSSTGGLTILERELQLL